MVYLYGSSDIGCEWNQQLQVVILVYISQVKQVIIYYTQKELQSPLILVLLSLKLLYKLKTWIHQRWFIILAYSEIYWSIPSLSSIHSYISRVYYNGTESGRKMRSNQNVYKS